MTFQEFKLLRSEGKVAAGIDNSIALRLIDYLPRRYQHAHAFWSWIWILSIPAALALSIFYRWWSGLLVLFFITPAIFSSTKKSAAQFVLEHAENDPAFFDRLVEQNILTFKSLN